MISNLKAKEALIGRFVSSPFYTLYAERQFGDPIASAALAWMQAFSDRVIQDALTPEDENLIQRAEASIAIAEDLSINSSLMSDGDRVRILDRLAERYPPEIDPEDEDSESGTLS